MVKMMFNNFLSCFFISTLVIIVALLLDRDPKPIFGIYRRANGVYWLKVWFMYISLVLRKIYNLLSPISIDYYRNLDKVQKLITTSNAVDAVYFTGANKNLDYLAVGTARRPNRLVDGLFYLKIKDCQVGLMECIKSPDTSLFNSGEEESYEAEGIKIEQIEPMRKWRITFSGQLRETYNHNKVHDVSLEALFTSNEPCFNYDRDMDAWTEAKVLAYEKWSRSYFQNVKEAHQLHYEQFGNVQIKASIDGENFQFQIDSVRDHTVASNRDWGSFKRYALHWITLENGDHFSVGSICQPVSFSRMSIGYMYNAKKGKMYPVVDSNLHLYQYGECGNPPMDYAFTFRADNTDYEMQVNIIDAPYFYISKGWESKIYECLCKVNINGVKGYGGVEWQYRNVEGRNVKM